MFSFLQLHNTQHWPTTLTTKAGNCGKHQQHLTTTMTPAKLQNAWYTSATQCTVKTRVPKIVAGRRFKIGQNIDLFHTITTIYNIVPFSIQVGQKQVGFAVCFLSERGVNTKCLHRAQKYTLWDLSATQTVSSKGLELLQELTGNKLKQHTHITSTVFSTLTQNKKEAARLAMQ